MGATSVGGEGVGRGVWSMGRRGAGQGSADGIWSVPTQPHHPGGKGSRRGNLGVRTTPDTSPLRPVSPFLHQPPHTSRRPVPPRVTLTPFSRPFAQSEKRKSTTMTPAVRDLLSCERHLPGVVSQLRRHLDPI